MSGFSAVPVNIKFRSFILPSLHYEKLDSLSLFFTHTRTYKHTHTFTSVLVRNLTDIMHSPYPNFNHQNHRHNANSHPNADLNLILNLKPSLWSPLKLWALCFCSWPTGLKFHTARILVPLTWTQYPNIYKISIVLYV